MPRRMSGDGSLYRQKSDGRWFAAISVGPRGDRKTYRRSAGKRDNTKAGAKRALERLRAEIGRPTERTTLGEYLERWLGDYVRREKVGASQARNARGIVKLWLVPGLGAYRLDELRKSDVERFLVGVERASSTKRHIYDLLALALDDAVDDGLLVRNPVRLVDRPSGAAPDFPPWTVEQMSAFLRAAEGDWYHPLFVVAAATGLRQGELLGLAWADVDLERAVAHIRVQLQRRDGEYVRPPRKSGGKAYWINLPAIAVEALRAVKARQPATLDGGLVFTTEHGRPVNGSVPTHRLARIAAAAGLPHQDFHSFRRFAASAWDSVGSLKTTQQQLGHASPRTTSAHYVFATDEQGRAAAAAVDALLRRAG